VDSHGRSLMRLAALGQAPLAPAGARIAMARS
jgi:hypothetical protein